jgi:hypothetical protein
MGLFPLSTNICAVSALLTVAVLPLCVTLCISSIQLLPSNVFVYKYEYVLLINYKCYLYDIYVNYCTISFEDFFTRLIHKYFYIAKLRKVFF